MHEGPKSRLRLGVVTAGIIISCLTPVFGAAGRPGVRRDCAQSISALQQLSTLAAICRRIIIRAWRGGSLKLQMTMAPTRGRLTVIVMATRSSMNSCLGLTAEALNSWTVSRNQVRRSTSSLTMVRMLPATNVQVRIEGRRSKAR